MKDGNVVYVQHALDQMDERGFTLAEVGRLLVNGTHDPSYDAIVDGKWRYRIRGKTRDGKNIKAVVEIDDVVVVITIID